MIVREEQGWSQLGRWIAEGKSDISDYSSNGKPSKTDIPRSCRIFVSVEDGFLNSTSEARKMMHKLSAKPKFPPANKSSSHRNWRTTIESAEKVTADPRCVWNSMAGWLVVLGCLAACTKSTTHAVEPPFTIPHPQQDQPMDAPAMREIQGALDGQEVSSQDALLDGVLDVIKERGSVSDRLGGEASPEFGTMPGLPAPVPLDPFRFQQNKTDPGPSYPLSSPSSTAPGIQSRDAHLAEMMLKVARLLEQRGIEPRPQADRRTVTELRKPALLGDTDASPRAVNPPANPPVNPLVQALRIQAGQLLLHNP